MFDQVKRPQLKALEPRRPAPLPLKPATAPAMPMSSVFTRPLEKPLQKKQRKACPACEEEGTTCPGCQKKAAPTLERPPSETQLRGGSPGADPAERQADELGKDIGEELKGTGSVGHGPLPKSVRDVAETHLGVSLEGTTIEAGSSGQKKAKDESALAVTEGKNIAFGEGQLDTSSSEGRSLLGHELVHVGQQSQWRSVRQRKPLAPASRKGAEAEEFRRFNDETDPAAASELESKLRDRCRAYARTRLSGSDFVYTEVSGKAYYVAGASVLAELGKVPLRGLNSCNSALRLAAEQALVKVGAPAMPFFAFATRGTPEHLWLSAAARGDNATLAREYARNMGAPVGAGLPARPLETPERPMLRLVRGIPAEPAPPAPPAEPPGLLAELVSPWVLAAAAFLFILTYESAPAPRWRDEINPITRRTYESQEEFEQVARMSEAEQVAARARYVANLEAAGELESRTRKGRWTCQAQCNVQQIEPDTQCPDRVYGSGRGHTQEEACRDAKRAATQSTPRGCYPRHCRCFDCIKT